MSWGYKERAVYLNYQLKLTKPILERIYLAINSNLPLTYPELKAIALSAEEFIWAISRLFSTQNGEAERRPHLEKKVEF